jgi:DNA-binding XRE family transcriptional regulator
MGLKEKLQYKLDNGTINYLTYIRELNELTVDELGSKLEPPVNGKVIFKLEKKNVKLSKHIAKQLAKLFNVDVSEFYSLK